MGVIKNVLTGEVHHLEVESLVGRAPGCSGRIQRSFVSARHAKLIWDGACWHVRDLVSRNGTFLDDQRLPSGSSQLLQRGSRIAFGGPAALWELVDESPPEILVTSTTSTRQLVARNGILAVPSCEDPRAMLYRNSDGRWVIEKQSESITPISAMQTFQLGTEDWRFSCPPEATGYTGGEATKMGHVQLNLLVSSRDEPLRIQLEYDNRTIDLGVAACDRLLVVLAHRRLLDAARGMDQAAVGWIDEKEYSDARPRGTTLNSEICRIRQQFSRATVLDPGTIVARRPRMRQLRIGMDRIAVSTC